MIPILLTGTMVEGFMPEATSCTVTEERNGIYELTMQYPVTGQMFSQLAVDKLLKAKPNDTAELQLFKIYEITKPINGIVTVNAEHISYSLTHYPVNSINASGNAAIVIQAILDNANLNLATPHNFTVATTGMTASKTFKYTVGSVRSALGGSEGSVLDTFGGEFEFDNYVIKLHKNRGTDTGVIVSYGKNLTDIQETISMESSYTHLFPYCIKDENLITITNKKIAVENKSGIAQRILIKDFSSFFESDESITPATLLTKANAWLNDNDINAPSINVSVSFIHLWQSPEYASVTALEKVSLCDYVTVRHPKLNIDIKAQVIKTVYNVLSEKYDKIELGSARADFSSTLKQATDRLNEAVKLINGADSEITAAYTAAIDAATKAITGNSGGYVVLNPEKNPQEILIMNTAKKSTATKMWRWNLSGLGYSNNGYTGPFKTAITMDGAIVADFITTGTLTANIIKAGILSSADGYSFFNLESGLVQTNNINITGGRIQIGDTSYKTVIADGTIKQHLTSDSVEMGGMVITGSGSNYYQTIYASTLSKSKGVSISYQHQDGTFTSIGDFLKTAINLNNNVFTSGHVYAGKRLFTNDNAEDIFAGVTHYRTTKFGGEKSTAYTAVSSFGCGIANKSPSVALQLQNYGDSTITARLDIYESTGEAYICLRGCSGSSYSKVLELGEDLYWDSQVVARGVAISSTPDIKENIDECGSVTDVLMDTPIYTYDLIKDTSTEEDAEVIEQTDNTHGIVNTNPEPIPIAPQSIPNTAKNVGIVIDDNTPDILLTEDKRHINLYSMVSLNWKATQEILSRLTALEGGTANEAEN